MTDLTAVDRGRADLGGGINDLSVTAVVFSSAPSPIASRSSLMASTTMAAPTTTDFSSSGVSSTGNRGWLVSDDPAYSRSSGVAVFLRACHSHWRF